MIIGRKMFCACLLSEKTPSNLETKVDIAEVIPPLRGPQSILEQHQGGVQEKGARAAILLPTASNPESAQDNYSSEM